jgi:hypothetical protein
VQRLNTEINAILKSPEELGKYGVAEMAKWQKRAKLAGINGK